MISVVFPVYLPTEEHKIMTDVNLFNAKLKTSLNPQWVIVETGSNHYLDESDIYIYEKEKTNPNNSINRAFKCCDGDFVCFLSNDVEVCDGWLEKMMECFDNKDCGIASLGTKEFNQVESDEIIERLYFALCVMKKEDAWFDPFYENMFDDSDLAMRLMVNGKKCYQNLKGIVHHRNQATYGKRDYNSDEIVRQHKYFVDKWADYKDHPAYGLFA